MNISVKVDDKDVLKMVARLEGSGKKITQAMQSVGPEIAAIAEEIILDRIRSEDTIGYFMANRTKVDAVITGHRVIISISGKTEGETEIRERSDGSIPEVSSGSINLWNVHEYGGSSGDVDGFISFVKDGGGGIRVFRQARTGDYILKYQGMIHSMIPSIAAQIEVAAMALVGATGVMKAMEVIEEATGGKVKFDRGTRSLMKRAGISEKFLASLGVVRVHKSSTGQINLLGTNPTGTRRFIGGTAHGIPTTIRR
jgi:hypothetical protein